MENKEFRFQGLDAKTEVRTALMLIIPSLMVMFGVLAIAHVAFPKMFFLFPLVFAAVLTVLVSVIILKLLVAKLKDKEWTIRISEGKNVFVKFRNAEYNFELKDIIMIKNMGNTNIRYLTIETRQDKIKIRVGNTGFAPFSTAKDIEELDAFIEFIKFYIDENFNKKILKNAANPNIIPNFGVYVVKGVEIKYSLINKMKPWQIAILILGTLVLIMVLFMKGLFYYFDNH